MYKRVHLDLVFHMTADLHP